MARTIFQTKLINPYRSHVPKGFYSLLRGHTGEDHDYINEELPSPVTGTVVGLLHQVEMGNCLYIQDAWGAVHVFAHLSEFKVTVHQLINRGDIVAITGNTGTKTTSTHLHWEVITKDPLNPIDRIMRRPELGAAFGGKGYNTEPLAYLKKLYTFYKVPLI